jgi:iron complex outermembrane receptor protein
MRRQRRRLWAACLGLASGLAFAGPSDPPEPNPSDLTTLSIEDLLKVEVTSVARRKESLSEAAAAVYVLTGEEIHRSGATSIPEALRMVPGLEVARIDASKWAITARGFNGRFANKLLVLIDGRSVYSPVFSGVYWDDQDTPLDDVERIEVIRGPGASVWGSNAVNGVINIVTRSAQATRGADLSAIAGSEDGSITARYGAAAGTHGAYRVFARYLDRDRSVLDDGSPAHDGWYASRGGFRGDWDLGRGSTLTLLGDWHDGVEEDTAVTPLLSPPYSMTQQIRTLFGGADLLGRARWTFSSRSDLTLQFYYDHARRVTATPGDPSRPGELRDTYDVDVVHHLLAGTRQEVVWGSGYRFIHDRFEDGSASLFDPAVRNDEIVSAFLQDTIGMAAGRAQLTVGSKFEHNDYTGFEVQPDARLIVRVKARQSIWGALSRAVRTPSRAEADVRFNVAAFPDGFGGVDLVSVFGNGDFRSEVEIARQIGYRFQPNGRVYLDVAAFDNLYSHLRTLETGAPFAESSPAPAHTVIPESVDNQLEGRSQGIEVSTRARLSDRFSLAAWYSWFELQLEPKAASTDPTATDAEGQSPKHQAELRSYLDLPHHLDLDAMFRYVGRLESQGVPGYLRFDLRLGYAPSKRFEAALVLQDLLQRRHPEWGSDLATAATEMERSAYGSLRWRF